MYFKFKENDVFVNSIKTHPRVNFFIHSGTIYYNDLPKQPLDTTKWAYQNQVGAFGINYLADWLLTAVNNGEAFWALTFFQSPSVAAGAPHWAGRGVSVAGKWGQRLENGEIRSWVQTTAGSSLIFDLDNTGPYGTAAPEMLLTVDTVAGSLRSFSWYTSNASKAVGTYVSTSLPTDFDRYMVGARNSNNSIDNYLGGYLFGHLFGAGDTPSAADIAAIQAAFNTPQDTLKEKFEYTINTAISLASNGNIKFASIFNEGFTPISGTAPVVSGTITYRRFS